MKKIRILLVLSVLMNIFLIYCFYMETAFFSESHLWTDFSMRNAGILIFNDVENAPKTFVQHWNVGCYEKQCTVIDSSLSDGTFINSEVENLEIRKLDYKEKEANLVYRDCQINISNETAAFICKDGDNGRLGNHIRAFYKTHNFFRFD